MRILDKDGKEIKNPDLEKGYLTTETIIIEHHPAEPEREAVYETYEIEKGLIGKRILTPWQPAHAAWDETEVIQRYTEYTKAELAEIERQKKEAEEAEKRAEVEAKAEAERQAALNALPQRVDDIEEGIAEVGVMVADATTSMDDVMEALAEIGVMVAELSEK